MHQHVIHCRNRTYRCNRCNSDFLHASSLRSQQRNCRRGDVDEVSVLLKCITINFILKSQFYVTNHLQRSNWRAVLQQRLRACRKMWATFRLKTLKRFSELYCKSDAIHYVFQAYRKTVLKGYGLDPIHYFTI